MDRDEFLLNYRPKIKHEEESTLPEEIFQNITLRPILKMQHDLTINMLCNEKNFIKRFQKVGGKDALVILIEDYCKKELRFRNKVLGGIVGLMTIKEFNIYNSQRK